MLKLENHPTVRSVRERGLPSRRDGGVPSAPAVLDAEELRAVCLAAGADDVGFVEIERPALAEQREEIQAALPGARTLVSLVVRMNRGPLRSPARSAANLEFHHAGDEVNEVGRRIVAELERQGVSALNPAMGFPMEMDRFPGKLWVVSHKPVAVEAGLGRMGIHRNVIHPKFGSFVLLGTVVVCAQLSRHDRPIDYDPCLECKLCVAACPVGAIGSEGAFDFSACYTHNYREFMGGFTDWAETVADSRDAKDLRSRLSDAESSSLWQSLSFGANYKAAYCMSVCPAGEDVIGPWLSDRKGHLESVVKPLQARPEPVYVLEDSDAEEHVRKRFPHKHSRRVGNSLRPGRIGGFLAGMPLTFQRGRAGDLDARYHFRFEGSERAEATVVISAGTIEVKEGLHGSADLVLSADSETWLGFLRKDHGLARALLTRKVRLKGSPRLLLAFARCFPS